MQKWFDHLDAISSEADVMEATCHVFGHRLWQWSPK